MIPAADEPTTISIRRADAGNVVVEWTGVLQVAENINGPWTDIDAVSPPVLNAEDLSKKQFSRARQP